MITLFEGVPGSGKSLYAAGQILEQLSLGHLVICNYPFYPPAGRKYRKGALVVVDNADLTPDFCLRWSQIWLKFRRGGIPKEHQILLVVDEASTVFNPRDWQRPDRKRWLSFFAQHRKLMFDVILIAQQDIQIDRQIRGCIDVADTFADIRKYFPGRGWYLPPLFRRRSRVYLGKDTRASYLGTRIFAARRRWARAYDTFDLFGGSEMSKSAGPSCPVLLLPASVPCYRWKRPLDVSRAAG